eukprot:TRINITY_DN92592_c0_g1_i1.p1 TRINITY_DN92592_c0_g1~~TRINITY_DN92592_c0_g1_i1.p1  ORF type:complete len:366 (-),score=49.32 TRINITY_DN92592_c0_g1_i1:10-1107(-)
MGRKNVMPRKTAKRIARNKITKNAEIAERKRSEREAASWKPQSLKNVVGNEDRWISHAISKKRSPGEGEVLSKKKRRLAKQHGNDRSVPESATTLVGTPRPDQVKEMDEATDKIRPGVLISIGGLVSSPELNGQLATCTRWEKAKGRPGRWCVRLDGGEEKLVRPCNLKIHNLKQTSKVEPVVKKGGLFISPSVDQAVITCLETEKIALLLQFVRHIRQQEADGARQRSLILVVCNQVVALQSVVSSLNQSQLRCTSFNAETKQAKRDKALEEFHLERKTILVTAGDVALEPKKGLRVIVNYDFPQSLEQYCQRIRSYETDGKSLVYRSFITPDSADLAEGLVAILRQSKAPVDKTLLKLLSKKL